MPEDWWPTLDARRLRFAVLATFLALPVLILDNLPTRSNSAEAVEVAGEGDGDGEATAPTTAPATTATSAPPATTTAPPTTAPPTTAPAPTTTAATVVRQAAPPPTTTPPTTTPPTTAPPAPAVNEERGKATWYHWNPGECAHKTLPRGTVVTVTAIDSGLSTTCTVTDRGPYGAGRIIDLDSTVFDDLAGLGSGVIDVVITW